MKLAMYSGGEYFSNEELSEEVFDQLDSRNPRVSYLASCSEYGLMDFPSFVKSFKRFGNCDFVYYPMDLPSSSRLREEALNADLIFLSGGNTFQFLQRIRRYGLLGSIKTAAKSGTIIAGLSAGAILMSPCIHTASFPSWDRDENLANLKNWKALNLISFEFFPHYANSHRFERILKAYSKKSPNTVVAAPDSCGIFIEPGHMSLYGKLKAFKGGQLISL